MYWLRRIPAETRIVVLVVFLALFQAILLSAFGLMAIHGERQEAKNLLHADAKHFLQLHVAAVCRNVVRHYADGVFSAAFDLKHDDWRSKTEVYGGGLFTDAFWLRDDSILTPDGSPLWLPRDVVEADEPEARRRARELARRFSIGVLDEADKEEADLAFARRHPFARDEFGDSLALPFAASPLLAAGGEAGADVAKVLQARWIAVLNRVAGDEAYVDPPEVERFLDRADAAASNDPAYLQARAEQDRQARVLAALKKERPRPARGAQPALHRNDFADPALPFYVRPVGGEGDVQVLAVDRARLETVLQDQLRLARAKARPGVRPHLVVESGSRGDAPTVKIEGLPGWLATATISEEAVRQQASEEERFYWYIIGFSIAGILAGGFLTARVVMREVKLAKLKAGFVSNVSHGLKTPLTSIRMFAEMLRSGNVADEAERNECLDVITQETTRLGNLIQQVLDFGRLEARRRPFHWVTDSVAPVVAKEAERFRRATGLDDERFRVRVAVNLPPVVHDPEAFGELLNNLLSNAFKYSPPNDRRIELTVGPQQGRVVLAVEDNGPGVPARDRRKIFEQFYRADDLLTRGVEGTGLGLSIARNIVRAHGGRILVESSATLKGSRFVVVLPAARRRRAAPAESAAETSR